MKVNFKDVPIGASFISNGNFCTKVSTRSAVLVQYLRTFYFKGHDQPSVTTTPLTMICTSLPKNWKAQSRAMTLLTLMTIHSAT
jgi:hypothetical protein